MDRVRTDNRTKNCAEQGPSSGLVFIKIMSPLSPPPPPPPPQQQALVPVSRAVPVVELKWNRTSYSIATGDRTRAPGLTKRTVSRARTRRRFHSTIGSSIADNALSLLLAVLLIFWLPPPIAAKPMDVCLANLQVADADRNGALNDTEFLQLILLYDTLCQSYSENNDDNNIQLSPTQLEKFVALADCPDCNILDEEDCCRSDNAIISIQVVYHDDVQNGNWDELEELTEWQLALLLFGLCNPASSTLVDALECQGRTTRSPTLVPTTTMAQTFPPSLGIYVDTPSVSPTVSNSPLDGSGSTTGFPSLSVVVETPTFVPVGDTEVTPEPAPSPTTSFPSLPLVVETPEPAPVAAPPAAQVKCESALMAADLDQNQGLNKEEYLRFMQTFNDCPGLVLSDDLTDALNGAFLSGICIFCAPTLLEVACCLLNTEVDVSLAYVPYEDRSSADSFKIQNLCTLFAVALATPEVVTSCDNQAPFTPWPSRQPVRPPSLPPNPFPDLESCLLSLAVVDVNGDSMLNLDEFKIALQEKSRQKNCEEWTDLTPTMAQAYVSLSCGCSTTSPDNVCCVNGVGLIPIDGVGSAVEELSQAEATILNNICLEIGASLETCPVSGNGNDFCLNQVELADVDEDFQLNQAEFLDFSVKYLNCSETPTSLSTAQVEAFNSLACRCREIENGNPDCCTGANAAIDIYIGTEEICTVTESTRTEACVGPAATRTPTLAPSTDSPVLVPPTAINISPTLPSAVSRTEVPAQSLVTNKPQITTNAPALTPSLDLTKDPISGGIRVGTENPTRALEIPVVVATLGPVEEDLRTSSPNRGSLTEDDPTSRRPVALVTWSPVVSPNFDPRSPFPPVSPQRPAPAIVNGPSAVPHSQSPFQVGLSPSPAAPSASADTWQECALAISKSDKNSDGFLMKDEFLTLIQMYSNCALTNEFNSGQEQLFATHSCLCLNVPDENQEECCLYDAKVSVDGSHYAQEDLEKYRENLCLGLQSTFGECVEPPTDPPFEVPYLDACSIVLHQVDSDNDSFLNKTEYLAFLQIFADCPLIQSLDLGHLAVFHSLACDCVLNDLSYACCLPGNAKLNVSGASSSGMYRSLVVNTTLSHICITANGLSERTCEVSNFSAPMLDCVDALLLSDRNRDGLLDAGEYFDFFRLKHSECSDIQSLSQIQQFVFRVLACPCLLTPGAELDCCMSDTARIDITSAKRHESERDRNEARFLSTICKVSNATVETGCRTLSPTFQPSTQVSGEVTVETNMEVVVPAETTAQGISNSVDQCSLSASALGAILLISMYGIL